MDDWGRTISKIENVFHEAQQEDSFVPVLTMIEALEDALSLLKAQEPAKPKTILTTGNGFSSADCPGCGKRISDHYHQSFCGYCGQAVKWNG